MFVNHIQNYGLHPDIWLYCICIPLTALQCDDILFDTEWHTHFCSISQCIFFLHETLPDCFFSHSLFLILCAYHIVFKNVMLLHISQWLILDFWFRFFKAGCRSQWQTMVPKKPHDQQKQQENSRQTSTGLCQLPDLMEETKSSPTRVTRMD